MNRPKKKKSQIKHPTIGKAFETENDAVLILRGWLPSSKWIARDEKPDFHIDYAVEIVTDREPTGLHFRAQVKGRKKKETKSGEITEPFESKHMRYYARCQLPVFLFLINPETKKGYWLFAQSYLKQNRITEDQMSRTRKIRVKFDPNQNLEAKELFEKEVAFALRFMRNEFPGSPSAAIAVQKRELEAIDPRFEVKIDANEHGTQLKIQAKDPLNVPPPQFSAKFTEEHVRLFQLGEPMTFKASDVKADLPILDTVLKEAGNNEIKVIATHEMSGSAHLVVEGLESVGGVFINGSWTMAPLRLKFAGELPESPLTISADSVASQPLQFGNPSVTLGFDFKQWSLQPLLHLANFDQLKRISEGAALDLCFSARGHTIYRGKMPAIDFSSQTEIPQFFNWLDRLRQTAAILKINPLYPHAKNMSALETPDVSFAVELFQHGVHRQNFEGSTVDACIVFTQKPDLSFDIPISLTLTNRDREIDFWGIKIRLTGLSETVSNLKMLEAVHLDGDAFQVKLEGRPNSVLETVLSGPLQSS